MRLGIMQPYFFPYIGYFSLISQVDQFIILDDVQFIRHGWIERNRILKQTGGWQYFAVPLQKHNQTACISEIHIDNEQDWKKKILAQLVHYKRAPYYRKVTQLLAEVFALEYVNITQLDLNCLRAVARYLHISTPITLFSDMKVQIDPVNAADEWALNICKALHADEYWNPPGGKSFFDKNKYDNAGINLYFQEVDLEIYSQFDKEFEAGLSILDVMMFNSPDVINNMLSRYKRYE